MPPVFRNRAYLFVHVCAVFVLPFHQSMHDFAHQLIQLRGLYHNKVFHILFGHFRCILCCFWCALRKCRNRHQHAVNGNMFPKGKASGEWTGKSKMTLSNDTGADAQFQNAICAGQCRCTMPRRCSRTK